MKILIFGSGYIGSTIINNFDPIKNDITVVDERQLSHSDNINFIQEAYEPNHYSEIEIENYDVVISTIGTPNGDFATQEYVNVQINKTILERVNPNSTFVFLSSSAVYSPSNELIFEDSNTNNDSIYAQTKKIIEQIIINSGKKYFIFRPFNVFGNEEQPYQNIQQIKVDGMIEKINQNDPTIKLIKTKGNFLKRDFVNTAYIAKVVATFTLNHNDIEKGLYNICSGEQFDYDKVHLENPQIEVIVNDNLVPKLIGSNKKTLEVMKKYE